MKPLTPTATAILDALGDGPATATTLRTQIGCSRSTIDKTLADLAKSELVARHADDHPDTPGQWTLTDKPDERGNDETSSDTPGDPATPLEALPEVEPRDEPDAVAPEDDEQLTDPPPAGPAHAMAEPDSDTAPDDTGPDDGTQHDHDPTTSVIDEVKLCRGCQTQMPRVCPTCWSKTTAYCRTCRKDMPTRSRGNGGDGAPEILANGLPKLTRGQLAVLVEEVMRAHPLPEHLGITGWTSGRIAVYLPGRSTGAIGNVLDKLVTTGTAEPLGDNPKRYRLATSDTTEPTTPTTPDTTDDTSGTVETTPEAKPTDGAEPGANSPEALQHPRVPQ